MAGGASFFFLLAGLIALETISHAFARRRRLGSAGLALRSAGLALRSAGLAFRARGSSLLLGLRNRHYALRRRLGLPSHARFQPLQRLHWHHLLLQLRHWLEQVAVLLGSRQHFIRFEHQQSWIAFLEAILNFFSLHRRGNRRPLFSAQRVHADRRLVIVVLAPVHQHLAGAQRLLHARDDQLRMLPLQ